MTVIQIGFIAVGVLILFGATLWLQPEWLIGRLRRKSPDVLYSIETKERIVALTIDDGPHAEDSPKILEILNGHKARATFFVITDHIPGNEEIVQRMVAEGHELGNHLTKDERSINLSERAFENDLIQADEVLSQYMDIRWMRPGSGFYNESMLDTIKDQGYQCALGSVYPYDPVIGMHWFSAYYVLWKIKPGDVIILHDNGTRGRRTARALEIILPKLERRGYQVVTLSELTSLHPSPPQEDIQH